MERVQKSAQVRRVERERLGLAWVGGAREQQGCSRHPAVLGQEGLLEERSELVVPVEVLEKRAC